MDKQAMLARHYLVQCWVKILKKLFYHFCLEFNCSLSSGQMDTDTVSMLLLAQLDQYVMDICSDAGRLTSILCTVQCTRKLELAVTKYFLHLWRPVSDGQWYIQ